MAGDKNFVLKGNICYSEDAKNLKLVEAGWLVCREGLCAGVFETLPEEYASYPVTDCGLSSTKSIMMSLRWCGITCNCCRLWGIWLLGRSAFYTSIIIGIRAQHALWNSLYPENTENQDIAQ